MVRIPKLRTAALAAALVATAVPALPNSAQPHGGVGVAAGAVGDGAASVSASLPAHWSEPL